MRNKPKSPPNSDLIQKKFEVKESGQKSGISERLKTGWEESSLNQAVEANNQRLFHQILEQKRENQKNKQENHQIRDLHQLGVATWPHQGWCGHLATPGPRKRGPSRVFAAILCQLGERLLPQSSFDLSPLVFPYKYHFQQRRKGAKTRIRIFIYFLRI